jgi:hypothetical protein
VNDSRIIKMRNLIVGAVCLSLAACGGAQAPGVAAGPGVPAVASARKLDDLLAASWKAAGVRVAPAISDGEFLRRASLDLIGRVPTLAETRGFLADRGDDRRGRLVDRLLASPEFGEHWADVYGQMLWKTEGSARIEKQDPRGYLVQAFNENTRYDRLTHALLTATGDVRENGAAAFFAARARGGGGPEAVAGAAARIFLGLSIQCAQCHDHPYDTRWKQQDFYGLVAYFARTRVRREKTMPGMDAMDDMAGAAGNGNGGGNGMPNKVSFGVHEVRRGEARMRAPRSETEVVVAPRFLGRPTEAGLASGEPRRHTLARAVLASDLFPKAMVARTWAQLFGAGVVDPWDDLGAENDPQHPPLLDSLARDFRAGGFDIKALLRRMVLSAAYARSSVPAPVPGTNASAGLATDAADAAGAAAVRAFARARVRPLSPEQLFRTLNTMTAVDEMVRHRQTEERAERLRERTLREYRFTFEDDEMADVDFDGSMPQALLLLNGELTNNGTRAAEGGTLARILAERPAPADRLEGMFLAAYARPPTAEEKALLLPALERAGRNRRAYEDVFFALCTSTEAVTNH